MTLIKGELSNEKQWRKPCRLQVYIKLSSNLSSQFGPNKEQRNLGLTIRILPHLKYLNAIRNSNKEKPPFAFDTKLKKNVFHREN